MIWVPGIDYLPGFIPAAEAADLLHVLHRELPWKHQEIVLFGKSVPQPRLTAWCSDPGVHYRYSGLRLGPRPWHAALSEVRARLNTEFGLPFNSVLLNAYRDGHDSMGWHADDEPELGPSPVIASVSLGAKRRFRVRPRPAAPAGLRPAGLDLAAGSLLLMKGDCQSQWQHCVPKTGREVGLRINLTFRQIYPD